MISFIVPTFKDGKYLKRCLNSIALSTSQIHDVVIIDDGSNDVKQANFMDKIASGFEHQEITLLKTENQGLASARNLGLLNSKYNYIRFVDSDDLLTVLSTDVLLDKIESTKSEIAIGDYYLFDEDKVLGRHPEVVNSTQLPHKWEFIPFNWEIETSIPIHSAIFKREVLDRGFQAGMRAKEDWVFWSRLSQKYTPQFTSEVTCIYVLHDNNMTKVRDLSIAENWLLALQVIVQEIGIPDTSKLHQLERHFIRTYFDRMSEMHRMNFLKANSLTSIDGFLAKKIKVVA